MTREDLHFTENNTWTRRQNLQWFQATTAKILEKMFTGTLWARIKPLSLLSQALCFRNPAVVRTSALFILVLLGISIAFAADEYDFSKYRISVSYRRGFFVTPSHFRLFLIGFSFHWQTKWLVTDTNVSLAHIFTSIYFRIQDFAHKALWSVFIIATNFVKGDLTN